MFLSFFISLISLYYLWGYLRTEYVFKVAEGKVFNSIKVMASMYDRRNTKSNEFIEVMEAVLGRHMYTNSMLHSESIDNASAVFQTPYESVKPDKRITENMKDLFNEIITDLTSLNSFQNSTDENEV